MGRGREEYDSGETERRGEEKRGTVAWHTASGHCVAASEQRAAILFLFEFAHRCLAWYPHQTTFPTLLFFSKKNCLESQENMPYSSYSNSNLFHFCRPLKTYLLCVSTRAHKINAPPSPPKRSQQFLVNNEKRADCQTGLTISYEHYKML